MAAARTVAYHHEAKVLVGAEEHGAGQTVGATGVTRQSHSFHEFIGFFER